MQLIRLIIITGVLLLNGSANVLAQFYTPNSFWLSPQLTAPTAMAGQDYHQISAHYQKQALAGNIGSRSMVLSGQFPLYSNGKVPLGTLGVNLIRQESGSSYLFATTGAMLSYNYTVRITGLHHLVGGIQAAYSSRKIDWTRVTTRNQFDGGQLNPDLNHGEVFSDYSSQAFTSNIGLGYYLTDGRGQQRLHVGAGMINANKGRFTYLENDDSQAEPIRWVVYAQLQLISNPFFELGTNMYWQQEGKLNDYVGGLQLNKGINPRKTVADEHLGLGLYYSPDQSTTLAMQLVRNNLLLGVSYSMPMGNRNLRGVQNAAEVTIGWRMQRPGRTGSFYGGSYRGRMPAYKANKSFLGGSRKAAPGKYKVNKRVSRSYKSRSKKYSPPSGNSKFSRKVSAFKAKSGKKKSFFGRGKKGKSSFSKNFKKARKAYRKANKGKPTKAQRKNMRRTRRARQ